MVETKEINLKRAYSRYLDDIDYIMHNLEQGKIYELTNWTQDAYLATNISRLRDEINEMLYCIQKNEIGIENPDKKVLRSYKEREKHNK